jgi:DNA-binding NtrC family response regulator
VIVRAVVLCLGDTILPEHLPPSLLGSAVASGRPATPAPAPPAAAAPQEPPRRANGEAPNLPAEIETLTKARIIEALERSAWNQTRAARMLGISRGTLISRLTAFGIARPRKRDGASEG